MHTHVRVLSSELIGVDRHGVPDLVKVCGVAHGDPGLPDESVEVVVPGRWLVERPEVLSERLLEELGKLTPLKQPSLVPAPGAIIALPVKGVR